MHNFKTILAAFVIMVFILFAVYPEIEINKQIRVCIIYKKSSYKIEIANQLEKKLNEKDIIVEKDFIRNINKYDPYEYGAVIILSDVAIFTPNLMVINYIKKHNYKKNIIYFCSTYYKETAVAFLDEDKIDVITSASEKSNMEEAVNKILENLNNLINQN